MTSIAATVITPALLSPASNLSGGAIRRTPATMSATINDSTGSNLPDAIATRVAITRAAATYSVTSGLICCWHFVHGARFSGVMAVVAPRTKRSPYTGAQGWFR